MKYESRFEIDEKRYTEWSTHPMGRNAIKARAARTAISVAGMVFACAMAVMGVLRKEMLYTVLGAVCLLIFLWNITLRERAMLKKQYKLILAAQDAECWVRDTVFEEEKIIVCESATTTEIEYGKLTDFGEDERYFYLWRGADFLLRVPKDSFITGEASGFPAFIDEKRTSAAKENTVTL